MDPLAKDEVMSSAQQAGFKYTLAVRMPPRFVGAEDNVANLLTKSLTGVTFIRLRRIALGNA